MLTNCDFVYSRLFVKVKNCKLKLFDFIKVWAKQINQVLK